MRVSLLVCMSLCVTACATFRQSTDPLKTPKSSGEAESGYTYVPIDPFPVERVKDDGDACNDGAPDVPLLDALPDNAVRMLVEQFDLSGTVTYGASKTGANGESYRVTVDYINADTINIPVLIQKFMQEKGAESKEPVAVDLFAPPPPSVVPGTATYRVLRLRSGSFAEGREAPGVEFNIPVYVGVGLRVSANVRVVGANANISGIGVIGAEAEAKNISGSLVVQTLGVNGKSVAAALPIQSELNRTTAQNAIVAVGSIKALLYADETIKSPRVVGLYLPFPGGQPLVNALISELSRGHLEWPAPCRLIAGTPSNAANRKTP